MCLEYLSTQEFRQRRLQDNLIEQKFKWKLQTDFELTNDSFKVLLKSITHNTSNESNQVIDSKLSHYSRKKTTLDIVAWNFSMYLIRLCRPEFQKTVASFTKSTSQRTMKGMKPAYLNNFTSMNNLCPRFKAVEGNKKEVINQGLLFARNTHTPIQWHRNLFLLLWIISQVFILLWGVLANQIMAGPQEWN